MLTGTWFHDAVPLNELHWHLRETALKPCPTKYNVTADPGPNLGLALRAPVARLSRGVAGFALRFPSRVLCARAASTLRAEVARNAPCARGCDRQQAGYDAVLPRAQLARLGFRARPPRVHNSLRHGLQEQARAAPRRACRLRRHPHDSVAPLDVRGVPVPRAPQCARMVE